MGSAKVWDEAEGKLQVKWTSELPKRPIRVLHQLHQTATSMGFEHPDTYILRIFIASIGEHEH